MPKSIGMKQSDLSSKVMADIFRIYNEVAGSKYALELAENQLWMVYEMQQIYRELDLVHKVERRFGSDKLENKHSKLWIIRGPGEQIRFLLNPNLLPEDGEEKNQKGKELANLFKEKIEAYLFDHGLAIEF